VLVAFGIYGVQAYMVSQQTREIAIRVALGGERGHVTRMVLGFGLQLVAIGLILGVAASLMTNRLLVSQLRNPSARTDVRGGRTRHRAPSPFSPAGCRRGAPFVWSRWSR
jgi:ABC-type antimicrobial peptide transport system permease subunit